MKMMFPIGKIQGIFTNEEKEMLEIYRFIYFFVLSLSLNDDLFQR